MLGLDTWVRTGDRIGSESGAQSAMQCLSTVRVRRRSHPHRGRRSITFVLHSGLPSRLVTNDSMNDHCPLALSQISANRVTDRPTRWPAGALALLPPRWHAQLDVDICDVAEGAAPAGVVDQVAQIRRSSNLPLRFRLAGYQGSVATIAYFDRAGYRT